jgi:hypothetical protein
VLLSDIESDDNCAPSEEASGVALRVCKGALCSVDFSIPVLSSSISRF